MAIVEVALEYVVDEVRFVGILFADEHSADARPGVLVIPAGIGLGPNAMAAARRLAEHGYAAFATDYYGGGVAPPIAERESLFVRLHEDVHWGRTIMMQALRTLAGQKVVDPLRLGAIGWCLGGTLAFELARSGAKIQIAIGLHPGLRTPHPQDARKIRAKVLAVVGADDPIAPPSDRAAFEQEMSAGGVDWRIYLLGGVGHSFSNPSMSSGMRPGMAYDPVADRRAWAAVLDLCEEAFSTGTGK